MPKPGQDTAVTVKHHRAAGPSQLHWAGCYLGPLLCQGYQIRGSSTAGLLTDADMELLITHSRRLQTIISTVLDAGKGFTILGSATKTFQVVTVPLSAKRQEAPVFQLCQCKQFPHHLHSSVP